MRVCTCGPKLQDPDHGGGGAIPLCLTCGHRIAPRRGLRKIDAAEALAIARDATGVVGAVLALTDGATAAEVAIVLDRVDGLRERIRKALAS